MSQLSCSIIGHTPQRFKFKYNEKAPLCIKIKGVLQEQIEILYRQGVRLFYVDCSVGVDTWAAEIVLNLKQKKEFSEIQLFCAVPFPEHGERFTPRQKERYQRMLKGCVRSETTSDCYSPVVYKRCNYYMVDNTQYLLAVYDQDKSKRSNTGTAVNYAVKKGLRITFIHPDTAVVGS